MRHLIYPAYTRVKIEVNNQFVQRGNKRTERHTRQIALPLPQTRSVTMVCCRQRFNCPRNSTLRHRRCRSAPTRRPPVCMHESQWLAARRHQTIVQRSTRPANAAPSAPVILPWPTENPRSSSATRLPSLISRCPEYWPKSMSDSHGQRRFHDYYRLYCILMYDFHSK